MYFRQLHYTIEPCKSKAYYSGKLGGKLFITTMLATAVVKNLTDSGAFFTNVDYYIFLYSWSCHK